MKPPTLDELRRVLERFDTQRIMEGFEMTAPLDANKNYCVGGEWVKAPELVRRLTRRCIELEERLRMWIQEGLDLP